MLCRMITRNASGGRSYSRRMDSIGPLGSFMGGALTRVVGAPSHSISGWLSEAPLPAATPSGSQMPARRSTTALQNHHIGLSGACPPPPRCSVRGGAAALQARLYARRYLS